MPRPATVARKSGRLALAALIAAGALLGVLPGASPQAWGAPTAPEAPPTFSDISEHWARQEIEALLARGALEATGAAYEPETPVTRGEFVAVLVRALGYGQEARSLESHGPPFRDVAAPGSLAGYVNTAAEYDLVRGYPDGSFRADRPITRAEISALLVRVIGLDPGPPGPEGLPFPDQSEVPSWAAGYISVAYERGMVRGYPDGTFRPESGATRAEAACLIYRAVRVRGLLFDVTGIVRGVSQTGDLLAVDLWPSATPEVTPGVSGSLVFSAPDSLGPSGPGPTVYLRVVPGSIIYRNGGPAAPADVAPLDEVSLLLGASGNVVFAEAVRLDGAGRVVKALPPRLELEPLDGGERRFFDLAAWAPVFRGGKELGPDAATGQVAVSAGELAYFILDSHTGVIRALGLFEPEAGAASTAAEAFDPGVTVAEVIDPAAFAQPALSPSQAMALNASAVGARRLAALTRSDGRGIVIAVIDTGVDVSHPDLAMNTLLERKVIDWRDFSGEGDVSTTRISSASPAGIIETDLGPVNVSGIASTSGFYHTGVLSESQLNPGSPLGQDLDRNGSSRDRYLVLVTDRRTAGIYDTVYVDTDRDLDLSDETPLRSFRETGLVAWFGADNRPRAERCSFVVSDIRPDGNRVILGFDGNGHGTHVAAIAAAYGSYRGGLDGLAPGAKLMALKALGSSGDGTWARITEAVDYAARQGAHIILLSVANLSGGEDLSRETANLAAIAARHGSLVIVAAGNSGPGLATARGPGGRPELLTVGASLSPAMWQAYYGYGVPEETIWPFSAVGPRLDGSCGPDVLAPGSAISAAPLWLEPVGYLQSEGTSMAVPHAAGVAALLWRAGIDAGLKVSAGLVRAAIAAGAESLPGYAFVEQGYGRVEAARAWEWLARAAAPGAPGETRPGGVTGHALTAGRGFYARDLSGSAQALAEVTGPAGSGSAWLRIVSDSPWLAPEKTLLALPGGTARTLGLRLEAGEEGQLLSGRLYAMDGLYEAFSYPVTAVVPARFSSSSDWKLSFDGHLGPARLARHFFEVPPGVSVLEVSFGIPEDRRGYAGRGRVFLHDPEGRQAMAGDYVGMGAAAGYVSLTLDEPAAGVWEAVVYSSAALSAFDLKNTSYWLEAGVAGLVYDLPAGGWDVTVPARAPAAGVDPSFPASLLTRSWRPPQGADSLGRQSQVWGAGWEAGPGGFIGPPPAPAILQTVFSLSNAADAFQALVEGYGFRTSSWSPRPETYTLRAGETLPMILPRFGGAAADSGVNQGLLRVQIRNVLADGWHHTHPDLNLHLYRRVGAGWQEYASSAAAGVSNELIEVVNPPYGEYAVYVGASAQGAGSVTFELRLQWLEAGDDVRPSPAQISFEPGQEDCSLSISVEVPPVEGVYSGALRVVDRLGSLGTHGSRAVTAGILPLTVRRVGEPVQLVLAQGYLVPGRNFLTFRALTLSGAPVPRFTLELEGRRCEASTGVITVPWDVGAAAGSDATGGDATGGPGEPAITQRLLTTLSLPDGSGFSWAFHLPVVPPQGGAGRQAGLTRPEWLETTGFLPAALEPLRTAFDISLAGG
jgi:subtilisin family serine protease